MPVAKANASVHHEIMAREILARVMEARRRSDALFSIVRADSLYNRPIAERHRIIFYVGHLEAFDRNLLGGILGLTTFRPTFDRLFAFGIDPVEGGLPVDQPSDWPALEEVRTYVREIRAAIDEKLSCGVLDSKELESAAAADDGFSLGTLLNVAIEHRLMHVETLAYMLHQLPHDKKIKQLDRPGLVTPAVLHKMLEIPEGTAVLGLSRTRDSESFGWDNEYPAHTVHVPAFEIDQYMVTNRQYLDFMAAGGYETRALWTDDDWKWIRAGQIAHPVFWKRREQSKQSRDNKSDSWLYRTMFEDISLPLDWPVYVSHAEAAAYARWVKKSLPTEAEWHRAAFGTHGGRQRTYPWGSAVPSEKFGNFDFHRWDPAPVNAHNAGRSAFGVQGMIGNGWEWTSTIFAPFRGFEPFPFYRGYSADFFDGRHYVMKGGSARTAACMLRPTFRNWFQGHYQYVYAGFRCVNR
ncbi:MAG: SUMF1/EgtB/PvdO family nonheme iron enzyme [Terriglobales bacterium]